MVRHLLLLVNCFLLLSSITYGQDTTVDKNVFDKALQLEKRHPSEFIVEASNLFDKDKKNEASFLFYLGQLRYRYYIGAKSKIKSSDKETYNALQMVTGSVINVYLGQHFDTYLHVIDLVLEWDRTHDFIYFSKTKSPEKQSEVLKGLIDYKKYLIDNKEKVIEQFYFPKVSKDTTSN